MSPEEYHNATNRAPPYSPCPVCHNKARRTPCPRCNPTDRAIRNSPPACPDLDQEKPDADEIAAKQRQQDRMAQQELDAELERYPQAASSILRHAGTVRENTAGWIARRAALIVEGDRAAQHGPKERNHQNIADHWNAYLGKRLKTPLRPLDVALMMVELKIARTKAGAGQTNQDNYVDMAGYAACAGEIALGPAQQADGAAPKLDMSSSKPADVV